MKIHFFMDVRHPRLLDAEWTGSTFHQNVCIYYPPQHIITQQSVHCPKMSVFTIHHNISSHNRQNIVPQCLYLLFTTAYQHKSQYFPHNVCIYNPPQHIVTHEAVHPPTRSVFTIDLSISSYKTSLFIYAAVTTWQLILSLNFFNLHHDTWTNYNLMAIEFHNLCLWNI